LSFGDGLKLTFGNNKWLWPFPINGPSPEQGLKDIDLASDPNLFI